MNYTKLLGFLGSDKAQHFNVGAVFAVLVAAACAGFGLSLRDTFTMCLVTTLVLGAVKELLDKKSNDADPSLPPSHSVDPWDVAATTLGGVYVGGLFWLAGVLGR